MMCIVVYVHLTSATQPQGDHFYLASTTSNGHVNLKYYIYLKLIDICI